MRRSPSALVSLSLLSTLILCVLLFSTFSFAAAPDRIVSAIDSSRMVRLAAGVSLKAKPEFDQGPVDLSFKFSDITLLTVPTPRQQQALSKLLAQQQDPQSPYYHQWLTPEQYADRFGLSPQDVNRITTWLKSQGFSVLRTARGRNWITFSGTAGQVANALHTEIHTYKVDGKMHVANATIPSIPAALVGIVTGFRGLNDFGMKPRGAGNRLNHDYYDSHFNTNFIAPGDISTIYDLTPLYNAGIDGTGQKLAVVGQTDVYLADINDFRSAFGLSQISGCTTNASNVITACSSPNFQYVVPVGDTDPVSPSKCGDLAEADLDIEWSGATAKNAQIVYVNSPIVYDANCNFVSGGGVGEAFYDAIDNDRAPVVSMSYGICEWGEALNGAFASDEAELQFANSEGITFLNSSGDIGAAACDGFTNPFTDPPNLAVYGLQVSYPASSPEVTGVGGTALPFNDLVGAPFWNNSSGSDGGSALSYIPEQGWNDTLEFAQFCAANPSNSFCQATGIISQLTAQEAIGIGGGGGGASNCIAVNGSGFCTGAGFAKPSYQTVTLTGITPSRFVPDISLMASANFPGYIFCTPLEELGGTGTTSTCANGITQAIDTDLSIVGGTSVSTPIFAGIVSLLNQYLAGPATPGLGNINPTLYSLAASAPSAFHPVTTGNNLVYCVPGEPSGGQFASLVCPGSGVIGFQASNFDATNHYNEVTGLGSIDANALAVAWAAGRTTSSMTLTAVPSSVIVGQSVTLTATMSPLSAAGTVSFFVNGSSTALGSAVLNSGVAQISTTSLPVGTDSITAQFPGDGNNKPATGNTSVTVSAPAFTITNTGVTTQTVLAGVPGTGYSFDVTPGSGGFAETVTFGCSGLDATTACVFNPPSITAGAPGVSSVSVTLTITTSGPNQAGAKAHQQKRADNRTPWLPFTLPIAGVVMVGLAGRKWSKYSVVAGMSLALVLLGLLLACGSSSRPVAVTAVTPNAASLYPNNTGWPSATQSFSATVTNTSNTAVNWSISPSPAGASIDGNGLFTAPTIAAGLPATITVTATSQADSSKSNTATVALKPTTVPQTFSNVVVTATEAPTTHSLPALTLTVN